MSVFKQLSEISRDPDHGVLFGVCAGLSNYYGWGVRKTRIVAFLLLLVVNWPIIFAYVAAIFLLPTVAEQAEAQAKVKANPANQRGKERPKYSGPLRERYAAIEKRMRKVEAHLHGQEYQLRSAFRDLETS
ncbi:MAG: PspC domain-containing protein [Oceanococcus sp.]